MEHGFAVASDIFVGATLIRAENECFERLEEFENVVKDALLQSPVIHSDETGQKIKGMRNWLHVYPSPKGIDEHL